MAPDKPTPAPKPVPIKFKVGHRLYRLNIETLIIEEARKDLVDIEDRFGGRYWAIKMREGYIYEQAINMQNANWRFQQKISKIKVEEVFDRINKSL